MKWTKKLPAKAGYYWVVSRKRDYAGNEKPESPQYCAIIYFGLNGEGYDFWQDLTKTGPVWFAGPVVPPKGPTKESWQLLKTMGSPLVRAN